MNLDRDEMRIHNAFSQINVSDGNLERKIREAMMMNPRTRKTARLSVRLLAAVIAITVLAAGTVYAAVSLGAFDRFMEERDPSFAEVVVPVERYVIDQGLRLEVIGAQQFGDQAIAYVSLRDISGQNRLTADSFLSGGYRGDWMFGRGETLYFNEATNTLYFELNLDHIDRFTVRWEEDDDFPETDTLISALELAIEHVVFTHGRKDITFPVPLTELGATAALMDFPTMNSDFNRILVPAREGNFPPIPYTGSVFRFQREDNHEWISGAAIIDGYLHVQTATSGFASTNVMLTNPEGNWVVPADQTWFSADVNFQLNDRLNIRGEAPEFDCPYEERVYWANRIYYQFFEVRIPIDVTRLEYYSLDFIGSYETGVAGRWAIALDNVEAADVLIRSWEGSATVNSFTIESMTVNPLSINVNGTFVYTGAWISLGEISLETPGGIIEMGIPSGWHTVNHENPERSTFDVRSRAYSTLDVPSITAVIIDGVRIPLEGN
jgi:hypothetical protein